VSVPGLEGWPRRIDWSEFQELSERPPGARESAQIDSVGLTSGLQAGREGGRYRVTGLRIRVQVNLAGSWVVTAQKGDALLAHEQGHYDITGLASRDLLADLLALREPSIRALQEAMDRTLAASRRRAQALSDRYDLDTAHGSDAAAQAEWQRRIERAIRDGAGLAP
jgi:hypothetical protein